MIRFLSVLALTIVTTATWGQGAIRGKMTDAQTGETLIGANVVIKDPYMGAMADLDGNFSLEGLAPGTYEVVGSFIGYTPITETVTVGNEVVLLDFNLYIETYVIEQAAEVVAKVDRSRDVYMENIKKKSGQHGLHLQPANQASGRQRCRGCHQARSRREYGGQLRICARPERPIHQDHAQRRRGSFHEPSPQQHRDGPLPHQSRGQPGHHEDPNREPLGDWAGAYISVETKDFPEQFQLNYSSTVGVNDQTTFQQVLGSNQGSTDWLGFDDGSRALPNEVVGLTSDAWPYQQNANYYDALVYLGYEDQLRPTRHQPGRHRIWPIGQTPSFQVLPQLNNNGGELVDLSGANGLSNLISEGMEPLGAENNAQLTQIGQSFGNTWEVHRRTAPINWSHSLSMGNRTTLFGRPLGYIVGLQWGQNFNHYENGEYGRYAGGSIKETALASISTTTIHAPMRRTSGTPCSTCLTNSTSSTR